MSADALVSRLNRVKPTGPASWIGCCPAHEDKSPSLTIREMDDGRVLVHCFAGCAVEAILDAVGLAFDALFPPRPIGDRVAPVRRPFPAADVLEAVMSQALVVQQVAIAALDAGAVTPEQRVLLQQAVARIAAARDLVNG